MENLELIIDLHKRAERQGPGGVAETTRAVELAGLDPQAPLKVADIGCGTGASTVLLAQLLNADITAVDFLPEFLENLEKNARDAGLADRITMLECSMDALPFGDEAFDVIWSEGAIYNMGFESGIKAWRRFLKPGGILAVSEITWTTGKRPAELETYWNNAYPEIDTASAKIQILERNGYSPRATFALPEQCWLDNYYRPMQQSFTGFLERNGNSEQARAVVEAEKEEIALYEKYKAYYSYGMYIARKQD